jgi:hypothetical protein
MVTLINALLAHYLNILIMAVSPKEFEDRKLRLSYF